MADSEQQTGEAEGNWKSHRKIPAPVRADGVLYTVYRWIKGEPKGCRYRP